MARYINLDALCEILDEDIKTGDEVVTISWVKSWLLAQTKIIIPDTADVVPKSEVERLETEIRLLTENSISAKYPCCVSCSKGLILTKSLEEYDKLLADIASEVAREIFEEMRQEIKLALDSNYKAKDELEIKPYEINVMLEYVNGKITALRGIDGFIDEIEEKYLGKDINALTNTESEGN